MLLTCLLYKCQDKYVFYMENGFFNILTFLSVPINQEQQGINFMLPIPRTFLHPKHRPTDALNKLQ